MVSRSGTGEGSRNVPSLPVSTREIPDSMLTSESSWLFGTKNKRCVFTPSETESNRVGPGPSHLRRGGRSFAGSFEVPWTCPVS